MLKRLRIQFVCAIMGVSALILVVVFALILRFTQRNLENQSLMAMQSIAVNTREPGRPGNREEELLLPYFILEETRDGGIRVLGGSDFDLEDESLRATLMEKATGSKATSGLLPEYDLRYLRSYSPTGARVVFVDISMERSAVTTLIRTCLLIGTAALILLFLLSILLSRWFIRPVEKAWTLQKQFVADASHELKTPLTVILTNVELLQSPVCNENDRARFSQNILVMSRRMRGLTEELLELARMDNGAAASVEMEPLDLSTLTEEASLPFEALFFERGLELQTQTEPGIFVRGNAEHLLRLTEILLDNAQKYTAPGGPIVLRLERQGKTHCQLTVANPGEPISAADQENIFKRFYRAERSRSTSGSYGLGLPIASSIVTAHNGRIQAESSGGINRFVVTLPLCHEK